MKKIFIFFLIAIFVFSGCNGNTSSSTTNDNGIDYSSEQMVVVDNANSNYKIITPQNGTSCELFAAQELQSFIRQSTGATLPIVSDNTVKFSKYSSFISVGETQLYKTANFGIDDTELKLDGFIIRTVGKQVFIRGARDRGTLYGVYDFLEKCIGIRFFTPENTKVPILDRFSIYSMNIVEIPAINLRTYYSREVDPNPLFTARSRMIALYGNAFDEYGGGMKRDMFVYPHNISEFIIRDAWDKDYPQFFYDKGNHAFYDICYSYGINEDGSIDSSVNISPWSIVLEALKQRILDNPSAKYFSVCQNDIPSGCPCDVCRKRSSQEKGGWSGVLLRFINALDNALQPWLKETYPEGREIKIATFAYSYTLQPPIDSNGNWKVVPNDNVVIWIAQEHNLAYSLNHERQSQQVLTSANGWKQKAKEIFWWDYRANWSEYWFYLPSLTNFATDIKYLESLNTQYIFLQASEGEGANDPVTWMQQLKTYVARNLMWNPDLDVKTLIDEYLSFVYGDSEDSVNKVINLFEDNFERLRQDESLVGQFGSSHYSLYQVRESRWYPRRMLEEAIRTIENEILRVENSSMGELEKEKRINRLTNVLCTPQRMLLRNYSSYYSDDYNGELALAKSFYKNVTSVSSAIKLGTGKDETLEVFREKYGL